MGRYLCQQRVRQLESHVKESKKVQTCSPSFHFPSFLHSMPQHYTLLLKLFYCGDYQKPKVGILGNMSGIKRREKTKTVFIGFIELYCVAL